jgi:isopenicillin N synthase-like dioxygenase
MPGTVYGQEPSTLPVYVACLCCQFVSPVYVTYAAAANSGILNRQQEWVPVTPCKPQVVVKLDDLMERWTNGKWVSSLHRVVPPEFERNTSHSRMSLAFFQQPDWDAPIECLPTCLNSDETAKYPGVTSGCYLMERFHSTVLD